MPRPSSERRALRPVRFGAVLLGVLALAAGLFLAHRVQVRRNATTLFDRGNQAVAEGEFLAGSKLFKSYLNFRPDDPEGVRAYAAALNQAHPTRPPAEELAASYLRLEALDTLTAAERLRLAELYLLMGNPLRARENLETLLAAEPTNARYLELLAQAHEAESDFPKAVEAARRAVATGTATPGGTLRLVRLLKKRVATPEAEAEAERALERLVADAPQDAMRLVARANHYARQGEPQKAYADAKNAYANFPAQSSEPDVAVTLALLTPDPSGFPLAREALQRSLAANPGSVKVRAALADIAARSGDLELARTTLRGAIEQYPTLDATLLAMGDRLADFGDQTGAELVAGRFAADPDAVAAASYFAGRGRQLARDTPGALAAFERAVADNGLSRLPGVRAKALVQIARLAEAQGDAARERTALAEALRLDPANRQALVATAENAAQSGDTDAAMTLLAPVAERDAAAQAMMLELQLKQVLSRPAPARDWSLIDRVAGAGPRDPRVEVVYASALLAQQKVDAAIDHLREVAARPEAKSQVGVTMALALAQAVKDPAAGLKTVQQARQAFGDSADLRLTELAVRARAGDLKAADVLAVTNNPEALPPQDRARVATRAASLLLGLDAPAPALALLEQAIAADPASAALKLQALELATAVPDVAARDRLLNELKSRGGAPAVAAEATAVVRELKPGDPRIAPLRSRLAEALSAQPAFGPGLVMLGELSRLAGRADEAITHYRRAVEAGEQSPAVVRKLVELLTGQKATGEAHEVLDRARQAGPLPPDLARQWAVLSAGRGRDDRANLKWAESKVNSTSADEQVARGVVLASANKPAEAVSAAKRAVELAPARGEIWASAAQVVARSGTRADLLALVSAAEKQFAKPTDAPLLAVLNRLAGRTPEARRLYEQLLAARPDDPGVRLAFATFLKESGDDAGAAREYETLARSPRPEVARVARRNLALELVSQRPTPKVRQQALDLLAQNAAGGEVSTDDRRTEALVRATDPLQLGDAIAALRATAAASPLSAEEQFYLGRMEWQNQNLAAAEEALTQATDTPSPAPQHLEALLRVQLKRSKPAEAAATLARLKTIAPDGWPTAASEARHLAARNQPAVAAKLLKSGPFGQSVTLVAPLAEELGLAELAESLYRADPKNPLPLALYYLRVGQNAKCLRLALDAADTLPPATSAQLLAAAARGGDTVERTLAEKWLAGQPEPVRDSPGGVLLKSALLDEAGNHAEAARTLESGLARFPASESLLNNAALLVALVEKDGGDRPQAWLKTLFELQGATAANLDTRAVVHLAGNRTDAAIADLTLALKLKPSPVYEFHLATAHDSQPESPSAVEARNRAIDRAVELGIRPEQLHPTERATLARFLSARDVRAKR